MERIEAQRLIPGDGDPIEDGVVVLDDDGTISYAGPADGAPVTPDAATHRVPVVMPGLWECHGHFLGGLTADLAQIAHQRPELLTARATADLRAAIDAGFTSVREAGGFGIHLAPLVEEGTLIGPTIYAPGSILSMTGGHGDLHSLPLRFMHEQMHRSGPLRLCDGVAECLKAVREQLRLNAKVIKICASGGVMSEVDHPIHQQFSRDELHAIVEEAGRADRIVMAHCHGKPGIMAALEAGCRTIEHGTFLDEESAAAMVEADATLVPTRFIVDRLVSAGKASGIPDYAYRKITAMADRHAGSIAIAREAGVRIALGTDIFSTGPGTPCPWGSNGQELRLLVDLGLTPAEAIAAATANAPATLGPQAPRSGRLEEGYDADVIAVASDPLDDVTVLGDPTNVTHVWKAGNLVKHAPAA